jgi:ketosteroid isomerase-like protein
METDETAAVRQAADDFYAALNMLFTGDLGPMETVWSHRDDVTYMGPGGDFRVGWGDVRDSWQEQADMKLGGKVEPSDMQITVGGGLAVTLNREIGENTHARGRRETVTIRATNIFRKEDGVWKMTGHHADRLAYIPP